MANWIWLNLALCAFFFGAIVVSALWLVFKHPDDQPRPRASASARAHPTAEPYIDAVVLATH